MNGYTLGLAASAWIVALVVAAAFAFAVFTYRRTSPPVSTPRRWTLIGLRTIGVGLLLLALFEPVLSLLGITAESPQTLVAIDESASTTLVGQDSLRWKEARAVAGAIAASKIGGDSRFIGFADSTRPLGTPPQLQGLGHDAVATRLEAPFTLLADSLRRRNIRAMVVVTDGRYNTGANPLFAAEQLGVPIYVVALGDSVEPRDLSVQGIFTNEIAYLGSELPVEVRMKSAGFDGGVATVTLRDNDRVIGSQKVQLAAGTNEYVANFDYKPSREGIAHLRGEVSGSGGELTLKNNVRSAYVKVKSNKRRYLLVAGGPNPDVAFIRRLLSTDPNIEVRSFIQRGGPGFIEGTFDAGAFNDVEAIVLVDFPTSSTSDESLRLIRQASQSQNLPLLVILGNTLDVNKLKSLESLLPVTFGVGRANEMQVLPELTEQGKTSPVTRVRAPEKWGDLPPIFRSETQVTVRPESEVLVRGRLGSGSLNEPLIVSRRLGRNRSLVVLGYGIFRWQLTAEGGRAARGEPVAGVLEDFIGNSLRWLAVADDDRQVKIVASKELYNLGESVRLLAQVYDESFNPVDDAVVEVNLTGPGGPSRIVLAPTGSGRYEGALGALPAGEYSFTGRATVSGKELGRDAGRFAVGEIGLEFMQPSMNAELLRTLAERTGGKFYTPRTSGSLVDDILANKGYSPRSLESRRDFPLWSYPWVLAAALLAFTLEWIIRKRSGML